MPMQLPLLAGEKLFAVLGAGSAAKPLEAWRALAAGAPAQPVWSGTDYAGWDEVMPYVGLVEPASPFLDWAASTEATDWGWLAVSSSPPETVIAHLRSLTKVHLPDGQEVFLRFWDGAQMLPILQHLGDAAGAVLPVFQRYLINGQPLTVAASPVKGAKTSPWWRVPAALMERLAEQSPRPLVDNLLQWLEEQRPDLYIAFPPTTLQHKVAYCVRSREIRHETLADYLASEIEVS